MKVFNMRMSKCRIVNVAPAPVATYEETFEYCTTADTQSGNIPGTDQGDAIVASGGGATAYVKTAAGGGYVRLIDETPSGVMFDLWQEGDLGITTSDNKFIMNILTASAFHTHGNLRFKIEQTSTGFALCQVTIEGGDGADSVHVYNGSNHYHASILANSTEYELKFVLNFSAHTFSMYVNGTLYAEYTDLAWWDAQNNAVLQSRCRVFDPGYGIVESSNNYLDILGISWGPA